MFKKIFISVLLVIVVGAVALSAYNTTQARKAQNETLGSPATLEGTDIQQENGQSVYSQNSETAPLQQSLAASGDLSEAEIASLIYLREEEKLAHDVYVTFYDQWELAAFQNIAQSEQTHTDSVKTLMDRYNLTDPASGEVGVFTDASLQSLYDELVAQGSQSLGEAIKAAGALEELDILDLESKLLETASADLQQVFNNLMSGSYNHLRAYADLLSQQTGETYQPQHLSQEAYQAILGQSAGSRNGRRGGDYGQQGAGANGGQGAGGQGTGGNGQQGGGSGNGKGYRGGRP